MRTFSWLPLLTLLLSCRTDKTAGETAEPPVMDDTGDMDSDADGDGYPASEDCDDSDAAIFPDAAEVCDGVDNDCDAAIDEEDAVDAPAWYLDADQDGFGDEFESLTQCDPPSGYVAGSKSGFDCNDADADFHPGADESDCSDPNDYNCDGSVAYEDADLDGWAACEECNDSDAQIHPEADEICDELDNDCDGDTDDADSSLIGAPEWFIDYDGDGFGSDEFTWNACVAPLGTVDNDLDCNDTDEAVHPEGNEVCNGIDDDCDEAIDDADDSLDASTRLAWYADADSDGFGTLDGLTLSCTAPSGATANNTDCDDSDGSVNPTAEEVCNEIDDDCDGDIDDEDGDVTDTLTFYIDHDGDGYGSDDYTFSACEVPSGYTTDDTDCDDYDALVSPGEAEVCNGIDDDCDGDIDDEDAVETFTWFADVDGDGYGDAGTSVVACEAPSGYISDDTDCDDDAEWSFPGATEVCDALDNDCDGDVDEEGATGTSYWYADVDGDGFGDASTLTEACNAPSGYTSDATDCDDSEGTAYPGATEDCYNDIDEDCDGEYSEGCASTYVECAGVGSMDTGQTYTCNLGATVQVDTVFIHVGCNDGETGSYTISFDDGTSETLDGSCNSTHSISERWTENMSLYMNSGGGSDNHISFGADTTGGWGVYYR